MADKTILTPNTELLINEAHTNRYLFVLSHIPTSYLISKFSGPQAEACIELMRQQIIDKATNVYDQTVIDKLKRIDFDRTLELNNDVRNFTLYLQSVNIPALNLEYSTNPTQFVDIKHVEGKLQFEDLSMTIMNDENWFIYRMLLYWFYAGFNPEERMKFKEYEYYQKFYVTGTLIILDNHYNKVMEFEFTDLHPVNLNSIPLTDKDSTNIMLDTTWIHTGFVPSDRYVIKRV
jgi:hypothetical protein